MTDFPGYLTIQQAAARLGVHRSTIYRHIERGDIAAFRSAKNASVRLVDVTDIEAIARISPEVGRKRKDWAGKDWADLMIEAANNHDPGRLVDILTGEIWAEDMDPPLEHTVQAAQPWDDNEDD